MFFSFDGIDGVGKSTQADLFAEWLRRQGREVVECRDPGSTPLGEKVRGILLDTKSSISVCAEMLLYMAARSQLVEEVVQPALATGKVVISDRFLLSNVVYQGHAGGLDVEILRQVGQIATAGVLPDLTFLLDMPPEAASQRLNRELDRMELKGGEFRRRLRDGFLKEAARENCRIVVVSADQAIETVQREIQEQAEKLLDRPEN